MAKDPFSWLEITKEPDLVLAQYSELKRQVPLLYTLLILNACAVCYTHSGYAPKWATIGFLGALAATCIWRIIWWIRAPDASEVSADVARAQLVKTTILAGILGGIFLIWSFLLNQYGGIEQQAHVALFIAATVIGCIFCLSNLPAAALLVTAIVTLPYLVYYILKGDAVFTAMALNIALVTGVMVRVLLTGFDAFAKMVRSQSELILKQKEMQLLNAENARLAHTDVLTGLPNRRYFFNCFEDWLRSARRQNRRMAIGVLDLDRFKAINDTYGHAFGDRLLVEVAARLETFVSGYISVARLGGDEFGLLFGELIDDVQVTGQEICDAIAQPFVIEGQFVTIGCSAGVAVYPEAGHTVHELFDRGDFAAYYAKTHDKGGCALFSFEHETLIRSELAIENALRSANFDEELHVYYQPILSTHTQDVLSVEALGRWDSPIVGRVPPDRFIVVAKKINLIHEVTLALFSKALRDFSAMPESLRMSFNLSAKDIVSPVTLEKIHNLIYVSGIDPKRITFELTETALMRDFDSALSGIQSLRALGARFALDDFGVGYSSLGHLRRLPFDKVKLDRSFIENMDEPSGRNILSGVLALCRTLELDCVAEGVETGTQLDWLVSLGCERVQGYLFAQPMSALDLASWLLARLTSGGSLPQEVRLIHTTAI